MVRLTGIEPAHMASEATALSPELQAHNHNIIYIISKTSRICKDIYIDNSRKIHCVIACFCYNPTKSFTLPESGVKFFSRYSMYQWIMISLLPFWYFSYNSCQSSSDIGLMPLSLSIFHSPSSFTQGIT